MENKDAILIRKMISLMEETDKRIVSESNQNKEQIINESDDSVQVDEQITKVVAADAKLLADVLKNEKGLFQVLKTEVPALARFKNADDMMAALNSGGMKTAEKFAVLKQVQKVPEVAVKIKGLLPTSKGVQEMGMLAFPKGSFMAPDPAKLKIARETLMKSYNMTAKEADDVLRNAAQLGKGESKVVSQFKGKKGGDPALNPNAGKAPVTPKKVEAPGPAGGKMAERWNKAKDQIKKYKDDVLKKLERLKGRLSAKQLALYGLAGYGAYSVYQSLFGDSGGDEGENKEGVIPSCVANLPGVEFGIGTGDVAVAKIPDGVDEKSNGHQGLVFWPNGRAITGDGQVRGNYYCKPGTDEVISSVASTVASGASNIASQISESQINEVEYQGVHIDWDGEKKTENPPVPVPPVPVPPKPKYNPCDKFPMSFGCKSDKIREIQLCLGMESKYQTGNFGPITQAKLTEKGYNGSQITEDDYLKILKTCRGTTPTPPPAPVTGSTTGSTVTVTGATPTPPPPPPPAPPKPESTEPSVQRQAEIIRGVTDRGNDYVYLGGPLTSNEISWMLKYYKASGINKMKTKNRGQIKYRFK